MKINFGGPRFYTELLVVLVLDISEITIIIFKTCQIKCYSEVKHFH